MMRQRFTQRSLAAPVRINICRIKKVQPRVHTDPNDPVRLFLRRLRPRLEELVRRAKRPRTEAKLRHLQTRLTKLSVFHTTWDATTLPNASRDPVKNNCPFTGLKSSRK